ncbi:hypothetical protein PHLCEN_2v9210 [Hermanssonia centrifuga]|uniref:Uncharacterized protein n=1 Tax=Hermanssonia centrifuga TaxID=98765 RepID=A0A2R6NRL6_9APHY|nr:hypothetical protein PHLCEN_2v9210 [Hermanssonia centrifuga]
MSSGVYDTVLSMDQDLSPIHDGISVGSPAFISQSSLASMSAGVPSMLSAGNSTPSLTLSVRSSVHFAATPSFGAGRSNLSREMPSLRLLSPSGSYAYRRRGGSQNGSGYSTEPSGTLNSQTLIDERTDSHYSLSLSEGNSLAPIEETNLQVPVNGPKNKRQSAMQGMRRWAQKILPIRHSSSNTTPNTIPGNEGGAVGGFSANKRDRTLTRKGAKAVLAKI